MRGWLSLPNGYTSVSTLFLVEVRFLLVLGLDLALKEIVLQLLTEIDTVSLNENT